MILTPVSLSFIQKILLSLQQVFLTTMMNDGAVLVMIGNFFLAVHSWSKISGVGE